MCVYIRELSLYGHVSGKRGNRFCFWNSVFFPPFFSFFLGQLQLVNKFFTLASTTHTYRTIQNYIELYRTIQNYCIQNYTNLYSTIQNYTALYRTIQKYTELYKPIQNYTELYRTIQNYTELYKTIQNYTELYRTIQNHTELYIQNIGRCLTSLQSKHLRRVTSKSQNFVRFGSCYFSTTEPIHQLSCMPNKLYKKVVVYVLSKLMCKM